jgi:hypothetical protein
MKKYNQMCGLSKTEWDIENILNEDIDHLSMVFKLGRLVDQEVAKALIMLHKGEIKVKQHPTNSGEIEFIFPTKEN